MRFFQGYYFLALTVSLHCSWVPLLNRTLMKHLPALTAVTMPKLSTVAMRTSEEDQAATLDFLRKIAFSQVHVFPYSRRPGTRADAMPGQLTARVKADRAHEAQRVADETRTAYLDAQIGRTLAVLFETEHGDRWQGHSPNYCTVLAPGENLHGIVRNVEITGRDGQNLVGNLV